MGSRAGLVGCGKSRLHLGSIPGPSSPYRIAILFSKSTRIFIYIYIYCDYKNILFIVMENSSVFEGLTF